MLPLPIEEGKNKPKGQNAADKRQLDLQARLGQSEAPRGKQKNIIIDKVRYKKEACDRDEGKFRRPRESLNRLSKSAYAAPPNRPTT